MSFKIKNIEDNTIIEIIAMNIDDENNILVREDNELSILCISEFKDMILGTKKNNPNDEIRPATYKMEN